MRTGFPEPGMPGLKKLEPDEGCGRNEGAEQQQEQEHGQSLGLREPGGSRGRDRGWETR